jgi:hypothetical protein
VVGNIKYFLHVNKRDILKMTTSELLIVTTEIHFCNVYILTDTLKLYIFMGSMIHVTLGYIPNRIKIYLCIHLSFLYGKNIQNPVFWLFFLVVLGFKLRASGLLGRNSIA